MAKHSPKVETDKHERISANNYSNYLFVKSQIEIKLKKVMSFNDVFTFLFKFWIDHTDKRRKK